METYNKIVRDKVPEILKNLNKQFDIEDLDNEKALEFLYLNLISTIYDEFENKSLINIAESIDILIAIAKNYGYTEEEIINQRKIIKEEKGDFSKNIFLKSIY